MSTCVCRCYTRAVPRSTSIPIRSNDARQLPAYTVSEASHYLSIPAATLRSWVAGRPYPTRAGRKFFKPVIVPASNGPLVLSFVNLVEAHVLNAIRRTYDIRLDKVRVAIDYLRRQFASEHPLADYRFTTDGIDLFIEKYNGLINISRGGQLEIRQAIETYLRRIERDGSGAAVKLYPFTRNQFPDEPKVVVIDPHVAFGRPVLSGTGIPTFAIAERYKAGESVDELAEDYGRARLEIEEAIRCELALEAA